MEIELIRIFNHLIDLVVTDYNFKSHNFIFFLSDIELSNQGEDKSPSRIFALLIELSPNFFLVDSIIYRLLNLSHYQKVK